MSRQQTAKRLGAGKEAADDRNLVQKLNTGTVLNDDDDSDDEQDVIYTCLVRLLLSSSR